MLDTHGCVVLLPLPAMRHTRVRCLEPPPSIFLMEAIEKIVKKFLIFFQKTLDKCDKVWYNISTKGMEVLTMEYKVRVANKVIVFKGLEWAKENARKASLVNFRAVVENNGKVVARYEWGKEI